MYESNRFKNSCSLFVPGMVHRKSSRTSIPSIARRKNTRVQLYSGRGLTNKTARRTRLFGRQSTSILRVYSYCIFIYCLYVTIIGVTGVNSFVPATIYHSGRIYKDRYNVNIDTTGSLYLRPDWCTAVRCQERIQQVYRTRT